MLNIIKLTLLLLGFSISLVAQNKKISIGLSASVDFNTYIGIDNRWDSEYPVRLNYSAGPVIKYNLSNKVSFYTGVIYSTKNIKEKIDLDAFAPIDPDDIVLAPPPGLDRLLLNSYLDLPFGINYRVRNRDKIDMSAAFGIINSFQLRSKGKTDEGSSIQIAEYNQHLVSSKFGLGFLMKRKSFSVYMEPQVRFYLSPVHSRFPNKNPTHFGVEFQLMKI